MVVSELDDFLELRLDFLQLRGALPVNFGCLEVERSLDFVFEGGHVEGVVLLNFESELLLFKADVLLGKTFLF